MSDLKRYTIPMSATERAALRSEARSYLVFFLIFGGGFALAAAITLWPFQKFDSFRVMVSAVLSFFFLFFLGLYYYQVRGVIKSLAAGKSVMYTGPISRKQIRQTDAGLAHHIYIGDRRFEIDEALYEQVNPGDRIAVREWLRSGAYLDHTTNPRRIAELEARAEKN